MDDERVLADIAAGRLTNLTAHERSPLPCLCKRCFDAKTITAETDGVSFVRAVSTAGDRALFYWLPRDLEEDRARLERSVGARLALQIEEKRRRRQRRRR